MLRPLHTLLEAVRARDWNPSFIFVGDYVNRGPDSRGVIELLLSLRDAKFIRGNHDDIFDLVLHDQSYASHPEGADAVAAFKWFVQHGMTNTLVSYGIDQSEIEAAAKKPSLARLRNLLSAVPASHRNFIRQLPAVVEFDDLFVAHALWDIEVPDDFSSLPADPRLRHRILWGRYRGEEIRAPKNGVAPDISVIRRSTIIPRRSGSRAAVRRSSWSTPARAWGCAAGSRQSAPNPAPSSKAIPTARWCRRGRERSAAGALRRNWVRTISRSRCFSRRSRPTPATSPGSASRRGPNCIWFDRWDFFSTTAISAAAPWITGRACGTSFTMILRNS